MSIKSRNREIFKIMMAIISAVVIIFCEFNVCSNHIVTWYFVRSVFFIILMGIVAVSIYNLLKLKTRFAVRTFHEILDDILGASMWKQLCYLFLLSTVAFLFSWLLMDAFEPGDASKGNNPIEGHKTFWLTICYFFDPGNLNLTPHEGPFLQGVISLIVAVLGMTLLTGLFISTFTNVLDRRVSMVRAGLVTYKKIRKHSVVIGFCEQTESVIRGLLEYNNDVKVVLLTNHNIEEVRKSLYSLLNNNIYDGRVVLYSGDYRTDENLNRLNLPVTKSIYVLGDDEMWSRDFENFATAQKISVICASSAEDLDDNTPIPLYVRMDRMPSFSILQRLNIDEDFFSKKVYFRPFNYYEHWTRMLWTKRKVEVYDVSGNKRTIKYPSLFFDKSVEGQTKYVHLVVSGFSEMGMSVTLQAIRLAHYGNILKDKSLRTKITVVDPNIDNLKTSFLSQFRHLEQIYDIEIDFRNCFLENIDEELTIWSKDKKQMLTIAICIGDADAAMSQALSLPLDVYYQYDRNSEELPRILVRQKSLSGVWNMLENRNHEELIQKQKDVEAYRIGKYNKYHNIYPFGMMVSGFYPNDMDDLKACLVHIDHEDNWIYDDKEESKKITIAHLYEHVKNDNKMIFCKMIKEALERWQPLPENIKWANRYQTDVHNRQKNILNNAGIIEPEQITEENSSILAMCSDIEHRRWVAERVLSGWQQSPFKNDGKPMRQDALLLHYNITSEIGTEKEKDEIAVKNILMLDVIYDYFYNKRDI